MDVARFNFSHGTHESHLAQLTKLKRVRDEMGVPVATILDTKGPEIRIKTFEKGPITLERGQDFTLTTDDVPALKQYGTISGGMIPKVDCCVRAIEQGVQRTFILDGRIPHSILIEMLTNQGIGTMIL